MTNTELIELATRCRRRAIRRRLAGLSMIVLVIVGPAAIADATMAPMVDGTILVPQTQAQTAVSEASQAEPTTTTTAVVTVAVPADDECFEDEPCWVCETMGNTVCGPEHPGGASVGGWPAEPTTQWVLACAEALGGATDGNLGRCADWANLPCGDPYVDPKRDQC